MSEKQEEKPIGEQEPEWKLQQDKRTAHYFIRGDRLYAWADVTFHEDKPAEVRLQYGDVSPIEIKFRPLRLLISLVQSLEKDGKIKPLEPHWMTPQKAQEEAAIERQIAEEYFRHPNRMGEFYRSLCIAIQAADVTNTGKLRSVYPTLVALVKGEDLSASVE